MVTPAVHGHMTGQFMVSHVRGGEGRRKASGYVYGMSWV
jgi:hypothetical protein